MMFPRVLKLLGACLLLIALAYLILMREDSDSSSGLAQGANVPFQESGGNNESPQLLSPLGDGASRLASDVPDVEGSTPPPPESGAIQSVDRSGLTTEEKIRKIVSSYERYRDSRTNDDPMMRATAEYWLAVHSAVTVMQALDEGQYEFDVDDGKMQGFKLNAPNGSSLKVAADNAKYEISTSRFPAVALAIERRQLAVDELSIFPELTALESSLYEQCTQDALAALGMDPSHPGASQPPETTSNPK